MAIANGISAYSPSAAFLDVGAQGACDDCCSICLESFCQINPAMVTSCKHCYHLQCILDWAQRSKECPLCWRSLSFKDSTSQVLFGTIEQERAHAEWASQFVQVQGFSACVDSLEERSVQGSLQNRSEHDEAFTYPSTSQDLLRISSAFLEQTDMQEARQARNFSPVAAFHVHSANEPAIMWADIVAAESLGHNQQKSDGSSLSESLKSHFLASSKWISKAKNGFKEKWRSRVKLCRKSEFWVRAQEGSADVVRQAIRRIAPDSGIKDIDVSAVSSTYLQIRNADSSDKDGLLSQINT